MNFKKSAEMRANAVSILRQISFHDFEDRVDILVDALDAAFEAGETAGKAEGSLRLETDNSRSVGRPKPDV